MKVLLLADNWVGWKVTQYLQSIGEDIVGLFVPPPENQHYADEIIEASKLDLKKIFIGKKEWSEKQIKIVKELNPEIILVVFWTFLLPDKFFNIPPKGCINFHLSYLPYNRGKKPNVWPIIDGSPAGVTMHYIDNDIDSGSIVAQSEVKVDIVDTGKTLYNKLLIEFMILFKNTWPGIKTGKIQPKKQKLEEGTFHWGKDFKQLDIIDLEKQYKAIELINLLRARTFPPHPSAFFIKNGRKVYVRVNLDYGEEV
jgi:methionyl-tRNA formyltransferase